MEHSSLQPIHNHSTFSVAELTRGFQAHERSRWTTFAIPVFGVCMIAYGAWYAYYMRSATTLTALLVGIGVMLLMRNGIHFFVFRHRIKSHPQIGQGIDWTLTEEGINCETPGSTSFTEWQSVYKCVETKKGFLIFPQKGIFFWLPMSGFEKMDDVDATRELLEKMRR